MFQASPQGQLLMSGSELHALWLPRVPQCTSCYASLLSQSGQQGYHPAYCGCAAHSKAFFMTVKGTGAVPYLHKQPIMKR